MPEQQNIEYKSSWHDDYLKWICGFANAQGGTIYIGKDDSGNIIGLPDYKTLMDEIPNKIRNNMGIMVEVNLLESNGLQYIEIIIPPYSVPISLRGRYYYRSGSTKQELIGPALNEFLLKKSGKTWDDVVEPRATINDIDEQTIKAYLKAAEKAGRLPDFENLSTAELLDKLRLSENSQLKRAAIVLFGKDPGKFYPSMFVKIGRFGSSETDLMFQEQEEGNIIKLLDNVLNQLNRKFLIAQVSFEGMNRIETPEYPIPALREMLLNALIHRNYMGAHIQIRVYNDKISIWNDGSLPEGITFEILKQPHASKPRNLIIADVCFKGGYIDSWGRGTIKIIEACKSANLPEPEFKEHSGGFIAEIYKNKYTNEYLQKLGLNIRQIKAVLSVKSNGRITNGEYQSINNCSRNTASNELANLVQKAILKTSAQKGAGSYYTLA